MPPEVSIAFQTDKSPAEYVALAKLVDQYAFDAVSVYGDLPFHPSFGPLLLMAPHIRRARLGPAGVSPSRMAPIDMASDVALLAGAARGGVYLGIVRGAWLKAHGVSEVERPIQAIRECIELVRHLLSGAAGGYAGQVYRVAEHVRLPDSLPEREVPVMVGTWGPKLAGVVGELADEVKVGGSANPDFVPVMRSYVAEGERRAGREAGAVGIVLGAVTVVDEDRQRAREAARREVALYLPVTAQLDSTVLVESELVERLRLHADRREFDAAARLISDDLLERFAFSGNSGDIIRQGEALVAAGVGRIEFGTPHGLVPESGLRMLGEQVVPVLKGLRP
jgi:5,10-methylenetetrahydromethanopterin reductase